MIIDDRIDSFRTKGITRFSDPGKTGGQDWLTVFADMMTQVLVFFVLLYIFSITGQLPLLTEALEAFQSDRGLKYPLREDETAIPQGIGTSEFIFSLPSQVLFDLGRAEIKPEAVPYLEEAVKKIKEMLVYYPDTQIRVEGYTDNLPIHNWRYRSNWELSADRAISVVRYLIEEHSFPPEQLQAMGYGEYMPIVPNDTPENRQKNRRVEIKLVKGPLIIQTMRMPSDTGRITNEH